MQNLGNGDLRSVEGLTSQSPQGPGLLAALWRFRWLIAAAGVAGAALGFSFSLLQTTVYEAEARLVLVDPRSAGIFLDRQPTFRDPQRHLAKQTERVTSNDVLQAAASRLQPPTTGRLLRRSIRAEEFPLLDSIAVIASAPTAQRAADIANAVGEAYQEVVAAETEATARAAIEELNEALTQTRTRLETLSRQLELTPNDGVVRTQFELESQQTITISTRIQQLAVEAAVYGSGIEVFERAELPEGPSWPRPRRTTAVAAVLAMFAAGAFAWWRAEYSQTAQVSGDVAGILQAPLLGEVPVFRMPRDRANEMALLPDLDPASAEAWQFVVSSLQFALEDVQGKSIAVTSVAPGDGKTMSAVNLAFTAAQDGRQVILLDGDERARGLTKGFSLQSKPGLADVVLRSLPLGASGQLHRVAGVSQPVRVIPAGRMNGEPSGLFRRPQFRIAMDGLKTQADLVVVDTPPILAVSDVLQIAGHADGVVVIVNRGTQLRQLYEAKERLNLVGTPILGYVFNRSRRRSRVGDYYYAPREA